MLFIDLLTVSPATFLLVSSELCVDFFDTAPPPHDLLAGVLTQLFFLRLATVLQVFILWSWSGNQLHALELGPLLGDAWSRSLHVKFCHTIILATDLRRVCHVIMLTAEPGGIRDINSTHANLDLGELCCNSYHLPDSLIPVLPSYDSTGLPASCAFRPMTPLVAHSNANWASDATIQRRSTSGSVAFVYGNLVTWKSATQKCVSLSTVEAEFIAATEATREVLFLKQLLCSIGIATSTPTVYLDNTGCIQVSKDPVQHWKLKHIDTKYHFICNNIQEGRVQVKYVDTKRNLADVLTKPVGKQAIQQARLGLHLQMPTAGIETRSPRAIAKPYFTTTA
ncbi:uncharacterized protein UDID_18932 [Ustilago sp. UG-2017a]|nr:uncharacterized protein UDID_18932 [Ustilago sp. UG-2017a]